MIPDSIKERLKQNWGSRADALACYAEMRIFDPLSCWECYFLALDPDEENAKVIIVDHDRLVHVVEESANHLLTKWNGQGDIVEQDPHFVRRQASALFKVLNERNP